MCVDGGPLPFPVEVAADDQAVVEAVEVEIMMPTTPLEMVMEMPHDTMITSLQNNMP